MQPIGQFSVVQYHHNPGLQLGGMCEIVPVGLSEETGRCNDAEDIATTLIKSDQLFQTLFAAKRCEYYQNNGGKGWAGSPKAI